jgi:hypothetical protein
MSEKLIATPAGMKWCAEHKQWEHIRLEGDLHIAVSEWHPHYKAHITAICAMIANEKCCKPWCGNPAEIVTDGLHTEFYCRGHWNQRCDEAEGRLMMKAMHAPLTKEEKEEFGIEEAQ